MASQIELLREARKRGLLSPGKLEALAEFEKRGLDKEVGVLEDVATSFGRGIVNTAIGAVGFLGDVNEAALGSAGFVAGKLGVPQENIEKSRAAAVNLFPTSAETKERVESVTGKFGAPRTTAGEVAQTVGEFAPGALAPGTIPVKIAQVIVPAAGSEAAGQLTEDTALEPFARFAGAILGGLGIGAAQRLVTPSAATGAQLSSDIAKLQRSGIKSITAGQKTDSKTLIKRESLSPETFAGKQLEKQTDEFTEATLRLAGIQAKRARQDVLASARKQIGSQFDDLQAQTTVPVTPKMQQDVADIIKKAKDSLTEGRLPKAIKNLAKSLKSKQSISGTDYKETRSLLSEIVRNTNKSDISRPISDIITILDDAAEGWLGANNPQLVGAFQGARSQFQNLLVIEKAASFAGKEAARGIITPARLQSAVKSVQGAKALVEGRTPAGQLSRAGVAVLDRPPSSGTPEGLLSKGLGQNIITLPGDAVRAFSTTRLGQSRLTNQAFPRSSLGGIGAFGRGAIAGGSTNTNR